MDREKFSYYKPCLVNLQTEEVLATDCQVGPGFVWPLCMPNGTGNSTSCQGGYGAGTNSCMPGTEVNTEVTCSGGSSATYSPG